MTRSTLINYALFGLAYVAIWILLIAPQTVATAFGTAPRGGIVTESVAPGK